MTDNIKIAVDAMGGENSPKKIIEGIKGTKAKKISKIAARAVEGMTVVGSTDKTFRMIFKMENLNKLMEGTYDVSLSSKRISHFKRQSDTLNYWIALEANSTYDE